MHFYRWYKAMILFTAFCFFMAFLMIFLQVNKLKNNTHIWLADQITYGDPNAEIELILFEDLLCEECKNFYLHILPLLEKGYIETKKVKLIFVPIDFLGNSDLAISKLMCLAKQDTTQMHQFMKTYYELSNLDENIRVQQALLHSNADVNLLKRCSKKINPQDYLRKNFIMAQKLMQGNLEVPTIFVQGKKLEDVGYLSIINAIDAAIAQLESNQ